MPLGRRRRRSLLFGNPFPQNGLQLWLDSSDTSTITHDASISPTAGKVLQHNDKSGNGKHAVQAVGALQPLTGTRTKNGFNVLDYNGSNSMEVPNFTIGSNMTCFVVLKRDFLGTDMLIEHGPDVNANDGFAFFAQGNRPISIRNGGVQLLPPIDTQWVGGLTSLISFDYDGVTLNRYKDSILRNAFDGAISNTDVIDSLYIGSRANSSLFMEGMYAEIAIFSPKLNPSEQSLMERYFNNKWDIY